MKPFTTISAFSLALIFFSSCETVIEYDLPREESKLTIDAKLLLGDSVSAMIGTSVYALSSDLPDLPADAIVWLYENNIPVSQLRLKDNWNKGGVPYVYSSNFKITANNTYKISASLDGYTTAFGQQLAREAVPIINTTFDSASTELSFTFQYPPTKHDYYMISIFENIHGASYYFSTKDLTIEFFDDDFADDPFSSNEEKSGYLGYLSDEYFNGKVKNINIKIPDFYDNGFESFIYQVQLWRISEDLYEHNRTKSIAWTSENPFSEPVQIYSNIENGYGIVGAVALGKKKFYP